MKRKELDIVFLLDRSGSMAGTEEDTIGGYNSYLESQRKKNDEVKVTTVLFDDQYQVLNNRVELSKVKNLTQKEYQVRGTTALLDAIGTTIVNLEETKKDGKVLFIITTDGLENASTKYNKEQIKEMINGHKNWEFIYIGANIDSYQEGSHLGIRKENIANYQKSKKGIKSLFNSIDRVTDCFYAEECISENWKKDLDE